MIFTVLAGTFDTMHLPVKVCVSGHHWNLYSSSEHLDMLFTVTTAALNQALSGDLSSDTVIWQRPSEGWVRCFKCSSAGIQELGGPHSHCIVRLASVGSRTVPGVSEHFKCLEAELGCGPGGRAPYEETSAAVPAA